MFERFTETAQQIIVLAREAARQTDSGHIETAHLLAGLTREERGVAYDVLLEIGVTREKVDAAISALKWTTPAPASGRIPFTDQSKRILELSLREALSLGHNYISTEHLLLGVVREPHSTALTLLNGISNKTGEEIRAAVIQLLSGPSHGTRGRGTATGGRRSSPVEKILAEVRREITRQDEKHGRYEGTRLGRSRLALATLEDEVVEALEAWRDERDAASFTDTRGEVIQLAAAAVRTVRDALEAE